RRRNFEPWDARAHCCAGGCMTIEDLKKYAEENWWDPDIPACPVCKQKLQTSLSLFYAHLLEHRIRFLEKIVTLYCDCDFATRTKLRQPPWMFCRRKIGDEALAATLDQMVLNGGK